MGDGAHEVWIVTDIGANAQPVYGPFDSAKSANAFTALLHENEFSVEKLVDPEVLLRRARAALSAIEADLNPDTSAS